MGQRLALNLQRLTQEPWTRKVQVRLRDCAKCLRSFSEVLLGRYETRGPSCMATCLPAGFGHKDHYQLT